MCFIFSFLSPYFWLPSVCKIHYAKTWCFKLPKARHIINVYTQQKPLKSYFNSTVNSWVTFIRPLIYPYLLSLDAHVLLIMGQWRVDAKNCQGYFFFVCWSSAVGRKSSLNPTLASDWSDPVMLSSDWLSVRLKTLRQGQTPGLCMSPPVICPLIGWFQ